MRLKSAFAKEAYKGRRLLWHAAKVVGIANEYLVSAPSEIIRVFMAYTFIMAYSTYGSRITSTTGDKLPLRLDLPCHEDTARRCSVVDRISTGGPAGLGSIENVYSDRCVSALSRDAQIIMQRLGCWVMDEKFSKILRIFESKEL
ncbi:hypothetical protein M441DRAFT_406267 [Trichoderma asperellum CBS 433.97]|uniref:Uncharacterized protein n=1 Tax=Trichoderma asperellum (strain ATCC 204424 / CBS 433.97 / NBRC 101777) TaxID=1042311 RepID=A0A2T3ZAV0_TRIA4|nr:hypothetical protein M441DRAFT_406267 [Trichoderma asperellum CBS 433.97]PTB41900.1 hypothetical protein M441DRAFT_406267 [Trichoderma asperellum CBS 433.97]